MGISYVNIMWDFSEFYDSLSPVLALRAALRQGYPPRLVAMSAAT